MAKKIPRKTVKKKTTGKTRSRRAKAASKRSGTTKKTGPKGAAKSAKSTRKPAARKPTAKLRPSSKAAAKSTAKATATVGATRRRSTRKTAVAAVPAEEPLVRAKPARALTRAACEPYRQLLLEKRAQLVGDVSTLQDEALSRNRQDAAGDLSNMPIHMADLGTDNYEQEFTLGLIEGERRLLREIDEALERIEKGTYGVCLATGRPVGRARLKAQPWARYCYEYMLAQEKGQKGRF